MIKSLFTALAISTVALIPSLAKAEDGQILGYRVTVVDNGAGTHDAMTAYGPDGVETIGVKCTGWGGYEFNSFGPNELTWVDAMAREWCATY